MAITIKRPTKTVDLCTDLELVAEHERLSEQALESRKHGVQDDRITGDPTAARILELEKLMQDSVLVFTLQALPTKKWEELKAAHPARDGDETDAMFGVNVSTFVDVAMPDSVLSVVQKTTGDAVEWGTWDALEGQLSNGQWQVFAVRLMEANNTRGAVPFSRAVSRMTPTSGAN